MKLPLELKRFKIQPYLADEVFLNFGEGGYNRNRLYSGVSFRLSSNIKGSFFTSGNRVNPVEIGKISMCLVLT